MTARSFDAVSADEQLGPVTLPVARAALVAYANASLDQNPIHQDEEFAKKVGLPDVIAHGMWTMGAAGTVVSDWVGDTGRVVQYSTRFTKPVVVPGGGAEIVVAGVVRSVDQQSRRATVELTTSAAGEKVLGRCVAVVQLD